MTFQSLLLLPLLLPLPHLDLWSIVGGVTKSPSSSLTPFYVDSCLYIPLLGPQNIYTRGKAGSHRKLREGHSIRFWELWLVTVGGCEQSIEGRPVDPGFTQS